MMDGNIHTEDDAPPSLNIKYEIDCKICKKSFQNTDEYSDHLKTHKNLSIARRKSRNLKVDPYSCSFCDKIELGAIQLRAHLEAEHKDEAKFECPKCYRPFFTASKFSWHEKMSHKLPYSCEICELSFRAPSTLAKHMKKHTTKTRFTCKQCRKSFKSRNFLDKHLFYRHKIGNYKKKEKAIVKPKTVRVSSSHLDGKNEEPKVQKKAPNLKKRLLKKKRQTINKLKEITLVKKQMEIKLEVEEPAKETLKSKTETDLKDSSQLLSASTTTTTTIIIIPRLQVTEKPLMKCPICPLVLQGQQELQNHMKKHKHRCPICAEDMPNKTKYKAHIKFHENNNLNNYPNECEVCGKKFIHSLSVKMHIEKQHTDYINSVIKVEEAQVGFAENIIIE